MKSKTTLLIAIFLIISSFQSNAQWTAAEGLDGMTVTDMIVQDSIIYLCGSTGVGVYYRHLNSTEWLNGIPNSSIYNIEITDSTIFGLGAWYTFMRSFDNGANWEHVIEEYSNVGTLSTIDNTVIISKHDSLFKSLDQGDTWISLDFDFPDFNIRNVITFDSSLFVIDSNLDSLLFSDDFGAKWSYINGTGLPQSNPIWLNDIVIYDDSIWTATREGIFVFTNNTSGWESRNNGFGETNEIGGLDIFNDTLFCAGTEGVFYLSNNIWIAKNSGIGTADVNCITHFDNYQFCGTEWGPFQNQEEEDWQPIYNGLNHLDVKFITSFEQDVWICTNKGLFKSDNIGTDFEHQYFDEFDDCDQLITTDSIFYLRSWKSGIFISRDSGDSWVNISGDIAYHQTGIAIGTDYIYLDATGEYRADHINYDWEVLPGWVDPANVWEIAAKDSIVILTVYNDATYTSVDNGDSFVESISSPAYEIIIWNNQFYAICSHNHLRVSDDGITWSDHPFPDPEWLGGALSVNEEAIVVTGSLLGGTIYDIMVGISYDGGISWLEISEGLPVPYWPVMSHVNILDNRIFASPSNQGLWYRDDLLVGDKEITEVETEKIILYPNPVKNMLTIDISNSSDKISQIKIYDVNGRFIKQVRFQTSKFSFHISDLVSGLYYMQIIGENGIINKKFIKQ